MEDKAKKEDKDAIQDEIKTFLLLEEGKFKTRFSKKYMLRKPYTPPNPKHIISFIPGTIRKVMVKNGSKVKKGDDLLQLEAMKMVNQLLAPMDGVIKKVHVKQGDLVTKNQLLVELA
ncbi:MAG: acetyl-CoA carboxylase biotin carboxyl carrier protein subunit [Lentimicrobiaceae bacterium]|nr:acetyl-CoA carboxylase biotin carboxyl carrier protein subunit [Lentimicrobiaceae bacterium]